jgi:hypothetical protein
LRRLALAIVAPAVLLSACNTTGGLQSPAPLTKTAIDDHGIRYAFLTLDTLASLADSGIKAGWLVPGSAKALAVANGLDTVRHALNAASAAQKAGSLTEYSAAFDNAQRAMVEVQKALGHQTGMAAPNPTFISVDATIASLRAA